MDKLLNDSVSFFFSKKVWITEFTLDKCLVLVYGISLQ